MTYSVILPTLNEKNHIIQLIEEIARIFQKLKKHFEIVVVDDNSSDGTIEILKKYEKTVDFLKVKVREGKKKNLASSINEGIIAAQNEFVIWMDADFQHNPSAIEDLIKFSSEYNFVICSRFVKGSVRYFDKFSDNKTFNEPQSILFNKFCKFFIFNDLTDFTSGYTCIRKSIISNYSLKGYYGEYFLELIFYCKQNKIKIIEIPFKENERASGTSKTGTMSFSYLIISANYFLCFLKCFIKKIIYRL